MLLADGAHLEEISGLLKADLNMASEKEDI